MNTAVKEKKPWYYSKTIWFNIAMALTIIGTEAAGLTDAISSPELSRYIEIITTGMLVAGNMILRFVTNKGIGKDAAY